MELVMRKAQPQDLDGLDQVMLVISDAWSLICARPSPRIWTAWTR